ncbi:MAG TPA: hypothetical protein VNH15_04735 [Elusimicrobiota bacterium]|nr:hypothetical protein [Elusimicrobiota bacterium]
MIARALAALLFCLPGAARAQARQGHFRLALIEDNPPRFSFFLAQPIEALSKNGAAKLEIKNVQILPCYYSGGDYRFHVPETAASVSLGAVPAEVLRTGSGLAFVYPPEPSLIAALGAAARNPQTYGRPWSVSFTTAATALSQSPAPYGAVLTAFVNPGKTVSTIWHETAASIYDLSWQGRPVRVIVVGKSFGGLGRQASVLAAAAKKGPLIGVARGEVFGGVLSEAHGTALAEDLRKMGLQYSGIGYAELRDWKAFMRYRAQNPNGIQFLSANIVYSSAPKTTVFPDHAVIDADGLRVVLAAVTPPATARYLEENHVSNMKITDPIKAVYARAAAWRRDGDAVVLLAAMDGGEETLADDASGADLILARDRSAPDHAEPPPDAVFTQKGRRPFDPPLGVVDSYETSVDFIDARVKVSRGSSDWIASVTHKILDDAVPAAPGYPEFDPESYGIGFSTQTALIPPARDIFKNRPAMYLSDREFWTMAASLTAAQTNSEISFLWIWPLPVRVDGSEPIPESVARAWLRTHSAMEILYLNGSDITPLLDRIQRQAERDEESLPANDSLHFTVGGLDKHGGIQGRSISSGEVYRVAIPVTLADALGLQDHKGSPLPKNLDALVLAALKARTGSPPGLYHDWAEGRATAKGGLWLVNFRDVSLNLQNTQVVNNGPFGQVPDSRIQGYNQLVLGGDVKVDANYFQGIYKWSNTLEMDYAKSRLEPPGQPPITNTSADDITALTTLTRKAGAISKAWLARSWGPSLGLEYDGQFAPPPGLPQQNTYSLYPGVQFYNGTWLSSWEISGVLLRNQARVPQNTQYGLHTRAILSHSWGASTLQGEIYANYSFLTPKDNPQDLRLQSDANLKLSIPLTDSLNIAPFIDIYVFGLKIAPEWGYSAMTGISLQFSRLWKPQYQPL